MSIPRRQFWAALLIAVLRVEAFSPTQPSQRGKHYLSTQTTSAMTRIHSHPSTENADGRKNSVQRIRAAVFQAPAQSKDRSKNPLAILTQVADCLRVASAHGVDVVLFPELYLSGGGGGDDDGPSERKALDRESYELNIVGNVCGELNVACVMGYAERTHESEFLEENDDIDGPGVGAYNSIAAFHADGSRAGNYRSVSKFEGSDDGKFREGHAFVECIPFVLHLPNRQPSPEEREIKIGVMCGNDLLSPEHCRHLARSGVGAIFAPVSFRNNDKDRRVVDCVIPSRAMENQVPLFIANFVGQTANGYECLGSSAIVSRDGSYLVCGPQEEGGDLPYDVGYLVPCDAGALYAADIDVDTSSPKDRGNGEGYPFSVVQQSIDQWDLTPRVPDSLSRPNDAQKKERRGVVGFGKDSKRKKARKFK